MNENDCIFKLHAPGVPVVQFQKDWYPRLCFNEIYHLRVEHQKFRKKGALLNYVMLNLNVSHPRPTTNTRNFDQ